MRKPKLREIKEALTSLFTKPYTTKFPYQPHTPPKRFRGRPKFDEKECVGCGGCANVCPSNAIELIDNPEEKKRILIHHPDKCIFCGECERNCITEKGIRLTQEFDISYFDTPETVENKVGNLEEYEEGAVEEYGEVYNVTETAKKSEGVTTIGGLVPVPKEVNRFLSEPIGLIVLIVVLVVIVGVIIRHYKRKKDLALDYLEQLESRENSYGEGG